MNLPVSCGCSFAIVFNRSLAESDGVISAALTMSFCRSNALQSRHTLRTLLMLLHGPVHCGSPQMLNEQDVEHRKQKVHVAYTEHINSMLQEAHKSRMLAALHRSSRQIAIQHMCPVMQVLLNCVVYADMCSFVGPSPLLALLLPQYTAARQRMIDGTY